MGRIHLLVVGFFPSPTQPHLCTFIGEQVRLLCERIDQVTVLSPEPVWRVPSRLLHRLRIGRKPENPYAQPNLQIVTPSYVKAPGRLLLEWTKRQWYRLVRQTVAESLKSQPVSVIHGHMGTVTAWASVKVAREFGIPSIVTFHGSDVQTTLLLRRKGWQLCYEAFQGADLSLPVSRQLAEILQNTVPVGGRCETMLLGVDPTRFFPAASLTLERRVLFVGRILEAKGVFDLLEAWREVTRVYPDARVRLVGPDRTQGMFGKRVRSLGLERSVDQMGPLTNAEVAALMRDSRVFCLPSHNEGTPVCVMEALSCGLPVVATRVGGTADIVPESTGILIEKGATASLARALISLLGDDQRCRCMGKAARAFALEHLDAARTADRLVERYKELIRNAQNSAESCRLEFV